MAADKNRWWTSPAEAPSGKRVIITGHDNLGKYIDSGKYIFRVEATWEYDALPDGFPVDSDAEMLEKITDAFQAALAREKAIVMTGIYTGDGKRDWIFYTKNLHIFSTVFNRALEPIPLIPFVIEAYSDPSWEEYAEMRRESYIEPGDE